MLPEATIRSPQLITRIQQAGGALAIRRRLIQRG
jgi:hypothetical protein